jgi:hypothetical protein
MISTLMSIQRQRYPHWHAHIVDDASPGYLQAKRIKKWCAMHNGAKQWSYTINEQQRGAVWNQYKGVRAMNPQDEDVIVFLDLDGDCFAHAGVLDYLAEVYADPNVWVTYGSYQPVSSLDPNEPCPVSPYPERVVRDGSYRLSTQLEGTRYNHLRTVKWKVLKNIPDAYYRYPDGEWLVSPTDLVVMMGSLELAGGRYKCIEEKLVVYNDCQMHPDNMHHPDVNVRGSNYTFGLPPLERLP